jgi:hypothetical protein
MVSPNDIRDTSLVSHRGRKFSLSTPIRCVTLRLNRRTCATYPQAYLSDLGQRSHLRIGLGRIFGV